MIIIMVKYFIRSRYCINRKTW